MATQEEIDRAKRAVQEHREKLASQQRIRDEANKFSMQHWKKERKKQKAIEEKKEETEFWKKTLGLNKKQEPKEQPKRKIIRRIVKVSRRSRVQQPIEPRTEWGFQSLMGSSGGIDFGAYRVQKPIAQRTEWGFQSPMGSSGGIDFGAYRDQFSGGIDFGAYRDPFSGIGNKRSQGRNRNPFSLGLFD
jgi:hypothetical protein